MTNPKVHGMITITQDFETMLVCAMRYAIGRGSYMPSIVIDYIRFLLPQLSINTLFVMQRDIREEAERYKRNEWELYMRNEWLALADNIDKEYAKKYAKKKAVQE